MMVLKVNKIRNVRVGETYIYIAVGAILMAIGANLIYEPVGLVTGGVSGIGIILKNLTSGTVGSDGIPLWLTNIVANIPLFIVGYKIKGKEFIKKSFIGTVFFTLALYVTMFIHLEIHDMILGAFYGGALTGLGVGLVLYKGGSTGGTDLLANIIECMYKGYSLSKIMVVIDGVIVVSGVVIFGLESAMYAVVAIFITMKMTDVVLEGFKYQKQVQIISHSYGEIAQKIMKEIGRGVTVTKGQGMYSKEDKMLLLCIISRKEVQKVISIVAELDETAFLIINDVREVHGEGFLSIRT